MRPSAAADPSMPEAMPDPKNLGWASSTKAPTITINIEAPGYIAILDALERAGFSRGAGLVLQGLSGNCWVIEATPTMRYWPAQIHLLCELLGQDAAAVWRHDVASGAIMGPRPEAWQPFNIRKFYFLDLSPGAASTSERTTP